MSDLIKPGEILPGITELPAGVGCNYRKVEKSYSLRFEDSCITTSLAYNTRHEAVQKVFEDLVGLLKGDCACEYFEKTVG
jgi:hypothetical protein